MHHAVLGMLMGRSIYRPDFIRRFPASFVRNFSVFLCLVSTMRICSENSGQIREDLVKDQTCQSPRQRSGTSE